MANPKPDTHLTRVLGELRVRNATVHVTLGLAEELMAMIRWTTATPLAGWVERALTSGDRDLANLARSLQSDAAAVQAALTERWSNGQVEGQVGRLKAINRDLRPGRNEVAPCPSATQGLIDLEARTPERTTGGTSTKNAGEADEPIAKPKRRSIG